MEPNSGDPAPQISDEMENVADAYDQFEAAGIDAEVGSSYLDAGLTASEAVMFVEDGVDVETAGAWWDLIEDTVMELVDVRDLWRAGHAPDSKEAWERVAAEKPPRDDVNPWTASDDAPE